MDEKAASVGKDSTHATIVTPAGLLRYSTVHFVVVAVVVACCILSREGLQVLTYSHNSRVHTEQGST